MNSEPLLRVTGLKRLHIGPLDLSLAAGECVTLSGPSGSGKSQLLRTIADLDCHEGELFLDGDSSLARRGHEWRRQVALLPAEPAWWADSVGEHFSPLSSIDEEGMGRLGFDNKVLGWSVSRCSTGERQRLALLRLLQHRPRILLLDEPTAALDRDNTQGVEAMVHHYLESEQAAAIWVSHDPEQIERLGCRQLLLAEGELREANSQ